MGTGKDLLDLKPFKKNYVAYFLMFCCLAVFLFVWLAFGPHGLIDLYGMRKEKEKSLTQIQELREKNKELTAEIRRLKGDPEYLESIVRKELGMVRENEIIYRFKRDLMDGSEKSEDKRKK